jgi:shikimate kinase
MTMKNSNNIFLIGPMGSGKTSIGTLLSDKVGFVFYDTDHEIETATGVNIPWIFDKEGEEGFRRRERDMLKKFTALQGIVLSTGGGIIQDESNRNLLAARGVIVYLFASVNQQYERVHKGANRPMVSEGDPRGSLAALFSHRDPLYREIADLIVETDGKSVARVAQEITMHLFDREKGVC